MATIDIQPPATADAASPEAVWKQRHRRRLLWLGVALPLLLLALLLATAPLSRTLSPQGVDSLTLVSADGQLIARRGAVIDAPVEIAELPPHVWQAFVAIEDRRFRHHFGIDPRGLFRAAWRNLRAGSLVEGASTITQQLAKQAYLSSERTAARKAREMLLALWLELRLSKDEILERYLSTAYFGDNVYGLRAAARHYFDRPPERLTVAQAALLAGLVKAPSRLAPTSDLKAAQDRSRLVIEAMVDGEALDPAEARRVAPATLEIGDIKQVPPGTFFTDWLVAGTPSLGTLDGQRIVETTLDSRLQALAVEATADAPLGRAEVALIAMRPDGEVVAMVGGRSHARSSYNRVAQARRQPGSTFKLFTYLAALERGMTPDSPVLDAPVEIDGWSPANADGRYRGPISLREAFALSSNVAAVRLAEAVGRDRVALTARRLGISGPLASGPSLALGASETSLMEMTAAFAGIAGNRFPVRPYGVAPERGAGAEPGGEQLDERTTLPMMLELLWMATNRGTGRAAALRVPTFGKTGTSQDNRDALYIGFAGGLVTGVWVGRDDNRPLGDIAGGGLPARIWSDFMSAALGTGPAYPAALAQRSETARRSSSRQAREASPTVRRYRGGKGKGRGNGRSKGKRR